MQVTREPGCVEHIDDDVGRLCDESIPCDAFLE
jgi:hypothetical protein